MKRKLSFLSITAIVLAISAFMIACNSKPKTDAQNSLVLSVTDTTGLADFQAWKAINERKDASMYMATAAQAPVQNAVTRTSTARRNTAARTSQPVSAPAKKKGWSKAAKGATIGGVAGAAAGAIIVKKNRALGAVVGGVIGGGVGYGIGRGMDKKDGRY